MVLTKFALLLAARTLSFSPTYQHAPRRAKALRTASEEDPYKASVQLPLSDRFALVYTCNRCETRNAISVSRVAWTQGVVIGKCMGCSARHMLADNTGLTDETNSTRFSNAVNDAIARGEEVRRLGLNDAAALADAGVELLPDGNVSLVAREGERIEMENDAGRVLATKREAVIIAPEADVPPPPPVDSPPIAVVDDVSLPPPPPQALPAAAPEVLVPPGPEAGDVLRCDTHFGVVHVRVPDGAAAGTKLRLEGVVEVGVPRASGAGDVVAVALPDQTEVAVELRPEDVEDGALLAIAFPVAIV